jgi:hypothetical protein
MVLAEHDNEMLYTQAISLVVMKGKLCGLRIITYFRCSLLSHLAVSCTPTPEDINTVESE